MTNRSRTRATLIASLTQAPAGDLRELANLPAEAEWLEVRADLVGEIDPTRLREATGRKLLYTLRSSAEGGRSERAQTTRRDLQVAACEAGYDRIDLEGERDLLPETLKAIPADKRLVSWHGSATRLGALERRLERFRETPAALYKMVSFAERTVDQLLALALLRSLGRDDVIAFAGGAGGAWTRLIAPHLGAPVVYGSAGDDPAAPGQPAIAALIADYGLPELQPATRLYGIVGKPVAHSLSPRLHNGAYRDLGLDALYLPFEVDAFADFWIEVVEGALLADVGLPLAGLSVTAPFKEVALAVAGASSPLAQRVQAANTLVWNEGVWEAETTDPVGVVGPLAERGVDLKGARAVVVGAGGAGRSAALGLQQAGAVVTLANRSVERGEAAAEALDLPFVALTDLDVGAFDVVVHATSLGRSAEGEPAPVAVEALAQGAALVDLVYGPGPTPLVVAARRRGRTAIDGREVLLHQALAQFRTMTGREMPVESARRRLGLDPSQGARAGVSASAGSTPDGAAAPSGGAPSAPEERS